MRLDELSSVVRLLRRIIEHSSSRRIMRLVPVFILRTHKDRSLFMAGVGAEEKV